MEDQAEFKRLGIIFREKLWVIYPFGDLDLAENYFCWIFHRKETNNKGVLLTPDGIIEHYKDYVQSLEQFQSGKYTKPEYKILILDKWLQTKEYTRPVLVKKDPLDRYLYGDMIE